MYMRLARIGIVQTTSFAQIYLIHRFTLFKICWWVRNKVFLYATNILRLFLLKILHILSLSHIYICYIHVCVYIRIHTIFSNHLRMSSYIRRRWWHPTPVLLLGKSHGWRSLVDCSLGVAKSRTLLSDFTFTFHFPALEKEMATYSSVLAWRIPGIREPGGLPSLGSHRVGHDWSDLAAAAAVTLDTPWFFIPTNFNIS